MKNTSRPHLLNLFNYKLFISKNKVYIKYINKLISSNIFKEQLEDKIITIDYLDSYINNTFSNEVFNINENGKISFLHKNNLIQFNFKDNTLDKSLLRLININIKNKQCYELILCIVELQHKFIYSNSLLDLKYFSHKDILELHKKKFNTNLVSSNISTISHNTFYKDQKNNITKLLFLIPKRYYIIYIQIKYILNIYNSASDSHLVYYLKYIFNTKTTISKVYSIRKRYLIPNRKYRILNTYIKYEQHYCQYKELTKESLQNFKGLNCVYELLSDIPYKYNYKYSNTIYIGSTNDAKKRLTYYLDNYGHTQKLRNFIKSNKVFFRFIKTDNYKDLEKDILDSFSNTCGNHPLLNTNRVL